MDIARGPLRDAAHAAAPARSTALVAGNAAVFADVSDSIAHDLQADLPDRRGADRADPGR